MTKTTFFNKTWESQDISRKYAQKIDEKISIFNRFDFEMAFLKKIN